MKIIVTIILDPGEELDPDETAQKLLSQLGSEQDFCRVTVTSQPEARVAIAGVEPTD